MLGPPINALLRRHAGRLDLGEAAGHPFRGNQWTDGESDTGLPHDEDPSRPGTQVTTWHATTKEGAEALRREGFDVMKAGGWAVLGRGAYGSLKTEHGRLTQESMGDVVRLDLEVTYSNPILLTVKDIDPHASEPGIFDAISAKVGATADERAVAGCSSDGLRRMVLDHGFDAIVVRSAGMDVDWDPLILDQVVVFNNDQVRVLGETQDFDPPSFEDWSKTEPDPNEVWPPVTASASRVPVLLTIPDFLAQFAVTASVQPLELGDLPGHDFHGNQWTDQWADMNKPELQSLLSYTEATYRRLNEQLRAGGVTDTELARHVANLDRSMRPLREPARLYRWAMSQDLWDARPGDVLTDRAFLSTTRDGGYGNDAPLRLEVDAAAGTPVIDVQVALDEDASPVEAEVLLARDLPLRVIDVTTDPDGTRVVHTETG